MSSPYPHRGAPPRTISPINSSMSNSPAVQRQRSTNSNASQLRPQLKSLAEQSSCATRRRSLIANADKHLAIPFTSAVARPTPSHLRLCALILSRLSMDHDACALIITAPYLPSLHAALAAAPLQSSGTETLAVRDGWRLAAKALRHVAAFSEPHATVLARESDVVKLLVQRLHAGVAGAKVRAESVECAAALANFARHGLQFQAYINKHAGVPALCEAAQQGGDLACKFHACRALAEFSLEMKWLMLLVNEGGVTIMLGVVEESRDEEILSEATRFLGNLATGKLGRESVNSEGGIEKVVGRIISAVSSISGSKWQEKHVLLIIDLLRTASNLCVHSKEAAECLINLGGIMAFIEVYGGKEDKIPDQIRREAFRGLMIIAQGGHGCRASVLREVGIKIRHDSAQGRCTAHLYDLGRRIKVEASSERNDDFPETIAGLGKLSKEYLFKAGPLVHGKSQAPNSVPDMKSSGVENFRQSGRILSVSRPLKHKERLERQRTEREYRVESPVSSPSKDPAKNNGVDIRRRPRPLTPANKPNVSASKPPIGSRHQRTPSAGNVGARQIHGDANNYGHIPTCKVVEQDRRDRKNSEGNWMLAVWSMVCNAVTRPPSNGFRRSGGGDMASEEDPLSEEDDNGEDVFEMGLVLGRGGFATVYLAKNLRTGELVAVKRFHPQNTATPEAKKKAALQARRAIKEQRIWDGLRHKNIVSYRGAFFGVNGELNLVAEYIPGWSLADHLSQITKFPEHMVACITQQIVEGLDYLHKAGVTHRDVKPANILVNPDGVIKITDFGVSSSIDVPTMTGNTMVGTPWYIAPEMIEGRPYGKSVDIWSLGCTVLELATGHRPYHNMRAHAAMFRMTQDRMPPIPRKLSPVLKDFLKTCWVWNPVERPLPSHLRRHPFLANIGKPEVRDLPKMQRR